MDKKLHRPSTLRCFNADLFNRLCFTLYGIKAMTRKPISKNSLRKHTGGTFVLTRYVILQLKRIRHRPKIVCICTELMFFL